MVIQPKTNLQSEDLGNTDTPKDGKTMTGEKRDIVAIDPTMGMGITMGSGRVQSGIM